MENVLVLASGGIDSSVCLHYYLEKGYKVSALFVDYGQSAKEKECEAVKRIARSYKVPLKTTTLGRLGWNRNGGEYFARNLTLISIGLNQFGYGSGLLSTGIHFDAPYKDCSERFLELVDQMSSFLSEGRIRVDFPLGKLDKGLILEYAVANNVPLRFTYSCERNLKHYCGRCLSCQELITASERLNVPFPPSRI